MNVRNIIRKISHEWATITIVILMVGFAAILCADLKESYFQKIEDVKRESENLSIVIEGNILTAIAKIDVVMSETALNITPYVLNYDSSIVAQKNHELLRLMRYLPETQDFSLRVIGANGRVLYNAGPTAELPGVVVEDRAYFQRQKNDPNAGLVISEPLLSRFTGNWLITLSRRINSPDGCFKGLVQTALRTEFFQGLFDLVDIGEEDNISLFDIDTLLLSRKPNLSDQLGKKFNLPYIAAGLASGQMTGSHFSVSSVDGIRRLFVYRKLAGMPYVVVIGRSPSAFLEAWWYKAVLYAVSYVGLSLALISYLVMTLRHRRRYQLLASVDELTGLANRRIFDGALDLALKLYRRSRRPLCVALFDIDHFKKINDTLGHLKGDDVLRRVVDVIRNNLREADLPCRWGGEEFIALLDGCSIERALEIAESIRVAVADEPMTVPDDGLRVTISIGVTEIRDSDDPNSLVARADEALYQAKQNGRNRVWPETA